MNVHIAIEYCFYTLLFGSVGLSFYLWFIKGQRDSRLLRISYYVRLGCGVFFSMTIPYVFYALDDAFPVHAIASFSIPFAIITSVLVIPWGVVWVRMAGKAFPKDHS